jgi:hypothetical protein
MIKKYPVYRVNSVTGRISKRLFSSQHAQYMYRDSLSETYFNAYLKKKDAKRFQKHIIRAKHKSTR